MTQSDTTKPLLAKNKIIIIIIKKIIHTHTHTHSSSTVHHLLHLPCPQLSCWEGRDQTALPPQLLHTPHSLYHVALHLFSYLLRSLSPLSQPIEAIAGVQSVVGVVVLTHSPPLQEDNNNHFSLLFISPFFLLLLFSPSLYPIVWSVFPLFSAKRSEATSLLCSSL